MFLDSQLWNYRHKTPPKSWSKTGGIRGNSLTNWRKELINWTHAQTQICWLVLWSRSRLRCSRAKTPMAFQLSVCPSLLICYLSAGHTLILWRGLGPGALRKGFTVLVSQGPIKTDYLLQRSCVTIVHIERTEKKTEKKIQHQWKRHKSFTHTHSDATHSWSMHMIPYVGINFCLTMQLYFFNRLGYETFTIFEHWLKCGP